MAIYNQSYDAIAVVKAYLKYETTLYDDKSVNRQYNWELTGAIEEYQKAYDLSVKDGYLNDETLKKMGFSINTNGKITNNSFYQKYLNIANQYMFGGSFKDDAMPEANTYVYNLAAPSFDNDYLTNRQEGNNEWNTMSTSEFRSKEEKLKTTVEEVKRSSKEYATTLPNASAALGRFVDENNLGKTLTFSKIKEMFEISDGMTSLYENIINRNMRAAESVTTYVNTAKYSMNYFTGGETGYSLNFKHLDWFMAVNGFVFGTYGNVTKSGNTYTMNLTIKVCDYYDWANEDEDPMDFPINVNTVMTSTGPVLTLVTVNETTLNDINRAGLGKILNLMERYY